jgi:hypothetical protein
MPKEPIKEKPAENFFDKKYQILLSRDCCGGIPTERKFLFTCLASGIANE